MGAMANLEKNWQSFFVPVQLVEDWNIDAESYDFKKLDPEADRQTINKYLLWEGDFGGKEVADGKVFK